MKKLFEKTEIGEMVLENRFVRSATWERLASEEGEPKEDLFQVYENLARGEIGLIITGLSSIIEEEQPHPGMMGIYNDRFQGIYKRLTKRVHDLGGQIVMQIGYGGTRTHFQPETRMIWGPSEIPELNTGVVAKEMSLEDIATLIRAFGDAAERIKKAGFDGVQVHGAHGYLLGQFLSPYHNRRVDRYGGTILNRSRLMLDVYTEIRSRVSFSFPIMFKINTTDCIPEGATFQDCLYTCGELAEMGIDAIELSGGVKMAGDPCSPVRFVASEAEEAYFAKEATAIAGELDVPVILVGGLRSPNLMERLLNDTKIECFAMSRPFLAEPQLIARWRSGDFSKSKCLSCNQCKTDKGNFCRLSKNK
jgi:2,4-dienoyl-CoA reductase-like NADH-dependent reductase (Old Yellow Enzyme family)